MNKKPVDKTKKSNIKCEHCGYCSRNKNNDRFNEHVLWCSINQKEVNYWNRCKSFDWDIKYK